MALTSGVQHTPDRAGGRGAIPRRGLQGCGTRRSGVSNLMRKAFTLIELLVVIAIIAAILFPVFAQAKVAAKKTAALSNQKQISTGLLMYMTDNDDYYPRQDSCVANSSLNPKLNGKPFNLTGAGCIGPYYYRVNH